MAKWIDISVGLSKTAPIYPGDRTFKFRWVHRIGEGGHRSNLSSLSLGSHTATHIDAPLHFLAAGKSIDQIPLDSLIGPCQVVEVKNPEEIKVHDLAKLRGAERILFKTRNSERKLLQKKQFVKDFAALSLETAKLLVKNRAKLVGIDYLSIEKFGHKKPEVHWALLKAGVVIVEGVDLSNVKPGNYELICLPLKILGAEGAPVRAVLKKI